MAEQVIGFLDLVQLEAVRVEGPWIEAAAKPLIAEYVTGNYFYNYGTRVPYDINLNMMDPAFRYEQKSAINASVPNPFPRRPPASRGSPSASTTRPRRFRPISTISPASTHR